ncbi:hypothetical protein HYU21_03865 [Candidatus Woesearchaeota archaeon]|nr:hypothetical protein [Candidatus Woesearchaeota archaeon]
MTTKTLGILGKGKFIQHLFSTIASLPSEEQEQFRETIDSIVFYTGRYKNDTDFRRSGNSNENNFEAIELNIKKARGTVKLENNFTSFFMGSDIIVDATAGFQPASLQTHIDYCLKSKTERSSITELKINLDSDYFAYQRTADSHKFIPNSKKEFTKDWNITYLLLQKLTEVNDEFQIGMRILDEFPFSAPLMMRRGEEISKLLSRAPKYVNLPTYINAVNEPCLTSNLLAVACPQLTKTLVAYMGYDLSRLERVLNEDERLLAIKKKESVPDYVVKLQGIAGWHDRNMVVPLLQNQEDEPLRKITSNFDARSFFNYMQDVMGKYWDDYHKTRDVNTEISLTLIKTIKAAAQSREKALSLTPSSKEAPFSNAYFQEVLQNKEGSNSRVGMFFCGPQRFRQGQPYGLDTSLHSFSKQARHNSLTAMREVMAALIENEIIEGYPQQSKESITTLNTSNRSASDKKESVLLPERYIVLANSQEITVVKNAGRTGEIRQQHPFIRIGKDQIHSLTSLNVDNVAYVAAAGQKNIYLFNPAETEERSLFISPTTNTEGVLDSLFAVSCNGSGNVSRKTSPYLLAVHSELGLASIHLEELLEKSAISLKKIYLPEEINQGQQIRAAANQDNLYLISGQKVFVIPLDHILDNSFRNTEQYDCKTKLSAITVDATGNWYAGTTDGKVLRNGDYFTSCNDAQAAVIKLQLDTAEKEEPRVLFRAKIGRGGLSPVYLAKENECQALTEHGVQDFWYDGTALWYLKENQLQVKKGDQTITIQDGLNQQNKWQLCGGI